MAALETFYREEVVMIDAYDDAIERELTAGNIKVRCAWHVKFFGEEKIMRHAAPGYENESASDSICAECREIFLAERSAA